MAPKAKEGAKKEDNRPDGAGKLSRKKEEAKADDDDAELTSYWVDLFRRVGTRMMRFLLVEFFLDLKEQLAKGKKDKDKVKKSKEEATPLDWKSPAMMLSFMVLVFAMRLGEEGFEFKAERKDEGVNHYDVLAVPTTADEAEIRQSYKKLALKWHPDKNKNCSACLEKFNEIAASYELLTSPDRRMAYDEGRAETSASVSRSSTTLKYDNYITSVRASNDVWVVQLYTNSDSGSGMYHPIWEDLSQKNQRVMRFGRIDMEADADALKLIPVKSGFPPTIFMVAPKVGLATVVPRFATSRASSEIQRYIYDNVPKVVKVLNTRDEVRDFFIPTDKVRVLFVGNLLPKMGFGLETRLAAYRWLEYTTFAFVTVDVFAGMVKTSQTDFLERHNVHLPKPGEDPEGLMIACGGSLASLKTNATVVRQLPSLSTGIIDTIEDAVVEFVDQTMPLVTQMSLELLCKSRYSRRYCLVVKDPALAGRALAELKSSRAQYLQELGELRESEDVFDGGEEEFWIQAVRADLPPGSLRPVDPSFFPPLAASAVLIELETMRYAEVSVSRMTELYQAIAYEDIVLQPIPAEWSLFAALGNPTETVMEQVRYTLLTPLRILGLLAGILLLVGLLPEFSWNWWKLLLLFAAFFGVFVAVIPAGRRDAVRWALAIISTQ